MAEFNRNFVQEWKQKLAVDLMGVASVDGASPAEFRAMATALLPGVKSVVVMGRELYQEVVSLLQPTRQAGEAEPGELLKVHTDYVSGSLNRAVHEMSAHFRAKGFRSLPLPAKIPTDERFLKALFSFKHAAYLAGLGTIGRHSLLITPEFGPRVRLACLLTEAAVEPWGMSPGEYCLKCDACVRACPARAIESRGPDGPYAVNGFACRAYRQAGMTCAVCMKACSEKIARHQTGFLV